VKWKKTAINRHKTKYKFNGTEGKVSFQEHFPTCFEI